MAKKKWKPGNMVYPLPAVLVSCGDKAGNKNLMNDLLRSADGLCFRT